MNAKKEARELYNNYYSMLRIKDSKIESNYYALECAKFSIEYLIEKMQKNKLDISFYQEVLNELNNM